MELKTNGSCNLAKFKLITQDKLHYFDAESCAHASVHFPDRSTCPKFVGGRVGSYFPWVVGWLDFVWVAGCILPG